MGDLTTDKRKKAFNMNTVPIRPFSSLGCPFITATTFPPSPLPLFLTISHVGINLPSAVLDGS
jgi:hypothetical protein